MLNFVISHRERRWRRWAEKALCSRTKKLTREKDDLFLLLILLFLVFCLYAYTFVYAMWDRMYTSRLCLYATRFHLYAANDRNRIEIESGFLRFAISGTDRSRGPVRTLYGFVADPLIYPSIYSRLWLTCPAPLFSRFS